MFEWHKADIPEVTMEFGADIKAGRINRDPKRKRRSDNNVFPLSSTNPLSVVKQIASDASLVLLIFTYIIAAVLGYHVEAFIAVPLLMIFFALSCFIKYRADKKISNSANLLLPSARIIENGKRLSLSALDVEVGDLICFSKGDIIPADARLVSSTDLFVVERFYSIHNQRLEYKRFRKDHNVLYTTESLPSYDNMVYATSMVVSGEGKAIVTAIGADTRIGVANKTNSLIPEIDHPEFLTNFKKSAKKFSLAILFLIIPFALISIYLNGVESPDGTQTSLLYTFLTMLALSATSMGELVSAPATAILTAELFKRDRAHRYGLSRFSSVEKIAATDTLLILCPEAIKDNRQLVRRVFYSDKEYRFSSLFSQELDLFSAIVARHLKYNGKTLSEINRKALKIFSSNSNSSNNPNVSSSLITFQASDVSEVYDCECFRTDGGSHWNFTEDTRNKVLDLYRLYINWGLNVVIYISDDKERNIKIFEGMVAIGEEYPFANGKLFDEYIQSGIHPILVIEKESSDSLQFALNCGLYTMQEDMVVASEYKIAGNTVSDAPLNTSIYIGFGHEGTQQIVARLNAQGKNVLPIIKDSSDKIAISPISVYATHSGKSLDSVKINSSISLPPADANFEKGGTVDALKCIIESKFAHLRLVKFKQYLLFATLFRLGITFLSLVAPGTVKPMPAIYIILSGFVPDGVALLALLTARGVPSREIRSAATVNDLRYAICGVASAVVSFLIYILLISTNAIDDSAVAVFVFYSSILIQLFALAVFLLLLKKQTQKFNINYAYILSLAAYFIFLLSQYWFPNELFDALQSVSFSKLSYVELLLMLILAGASLALVYFTDKIKLKIDER